MHSVRLDPFASRILAIRLAGNARGPSPEHGDDEAPPEPTPTDACVDTEDDDSDSDSDEDEDEAPCPGRDPPPGGNAMPPCDFPAASTAAPVGRVTAELIPDANYAVTPTDCHTCGEHDVPEGAWSMRELTEELRQLKKRVESLEYAAQVHGVDAVAAMVKEGRMSPGLLDQ